MGLSIYVTKEGAEDGEKRKLEEKSCAKEQIKCFFIDPEILNQVIKNNNKLKNI